MDAFLLSINSDPTQFGLDSVKSDIVDVFLNIIHILNPIPELTTQFLISVS